MTDSFAYLARELASLSAPVLVIGGAWVLVMICVPIIRWVLGEGAERIGISLGVVFQAAAVTVILFEALTPLRAALMAVGIPLFGWAIEFLGSRTGFPFGRYHYTEVLQPQIRHVPAIIPLAWLMMIPPSWAVGRALAGPDAFVIAALLAGLSFMAWDLFLDPQMVSWDFWRWDQDGVYLGIPLVNFVGWFGAGTLVSLLLYHADIPVAPLFLVYVVTWVLETIGQIAFWRLVVSGVTGFLAMGAFVIAVLTRLGG
jgi:putative membrane protein